MPNDSGKPPKDFWDHMKAKGMSDALVGWIFFHKFHGDRAAASASLHNTQELEKIISESQERFNKSLKETTIMERGCLTKCKDIKEAMTVLDTAKVPQDDILRFVVGNAMRYTEEEEKKKALEMAETEMEKRETAAHGTEDSHQSSGHDLPPFPGKSGLEGDMSASKMSGGNQMGDSHSVHETEEFDMGSCVARKIADGMDAEAARKACSGEKETHYRETVRALKKEVAGLKETVNKDLKLLRESMSALDKRIQETAQNAKPKSGILTFEKPISNDPNTRSVSMHPGSGVRETTMAARDGKPIDVSEMRKSILNYDNALNSI